MKLKLILPILATAWFACVDHAAAQGTAFTYQGQITTNGVAPTGLYEMSFTLYSASTGGFDIGGPTFIYNIPVTNGVFTVALDFGSGPFTGNPVWLAVAVATNDAPVLTGLAPRQELTPVPYTIFANSASNLSGTLPATKLTGTVINSQLANNSITVNAGTGLSGGGAAPLGGSTTLSNAGVTSLIGGGGVSVSSANGAVALGSTATSSNAPNAIVGRDGSGNFSAGSATLAGSLYLPFPAIIYSGTNTILVEEGSYFAGINAGINVYPGREDVGVGDYVLSSGSSGFDNTGIGENALMNNTSGGNNTAVGHSALSSNTAGISDTAVGRNALGSNTSGNYNVATGTGALSSNTTGSDDTAAGVAALLSNTTGGGNTADGYDALYSNTLGSDNTADGLTALYNNTVGFDDTADGSGALNANTSGFANTASGYQALYNNTTGNFNTAVGISALFSNTICSDNTAIGNAALSQNIGGSFNTATGDSALAGLPPMTGSYNTGDGYQALFDLSSGSYNVASGSQALANNSGGSQNCALGYQALQFNISGGQNTAIGLAAMQNNQTSYGSTACGFAALQFASGSYNIGVGFTALQYPTGNYNVGLGYNAGSGITTGNNNVDISAAGESSDDGIIRIGQAGIQTATYLVGQVYVPVLTITGGSDLAEPFKIASASIPKGSVVIIDEQHPGQLKLSDQAYDTRVAGIISGANGINPGISLRQSNVMDGNQNVALTGRVYALADTSNGAIHPGDMLTTSAIPGDAMKVTDHARAQGAILGKAMTGLNEGKGMVLVLVTLQ